ncbi:MAG TPA: hypothetical protein DDY13_06655, partial [Cytophagales bacterium]|nr:hypothetical protein [Cytophagales bacterium]
ATTTMAPLPSAGGKISYFGPFDSNEHPPKSVRTKITESTYIRRQHEEILGYVKIDSILPPILS